MLEDERGRPLKRLDEFAERLSWHSIEGNEPGGNVQLTARSMGLRDDTGNGMMQRIRKRIGWQAR